MALGYGRSMNINGSVGRRGRNSHQDVIIVQELINSHIKPPGTKLVVDGKCGPKTKEAITQFQRSAVGLRRPDGRVDPAGRTIAKLNDPNASLNYTPALPTPTHPTTGRGGLPFKDEMKAEFKKQGGSQILWNEFVKDFEENSIPEMKKFLASLGGANNVRALVRFYLQLNKWGLTKQEKLLVFGKVVKLRNSQALKLFETATAPAGKFGSMIGRVGQGAARAGIILTAIQCAIHASRGDYSVIPAEIYKFAMGKALPWAALIGGIQSLVEAILSKKTKRSDTMFKIMRAADPIDLGKAAVDSLYALVLGTFDVAMSGRLSVDAMIPRMTRLVNRLDEGSTSFFAGMGRNAGDALYELYTGPDIDWGMLARYTWSEFKEFAGISN